MLFNKHPWELLQMDGLRRAWYEEAAKRHRARERDRIQNVLNVIGQMLGGGE